MLELHARVGPSLGPALALTAGVNCSSFGTSVRLVYHVHLPGRTHSQHFRVLTKESDSVIPPYNHILGAFLSNLDNTLTLTGTPNVANYHINDGF